MDKVQVKLTDADIHLIVGYLNSLWATNESDQKRIKKLIDRFSGLLDAKNLEIE